jgi:hypothetical protein
MPGRDDTRRACHPVSQPRRKPPPKKIRHPERRRATGLLSQQNANRAAVEGPLTTPLNATIEKAPQCPGGADSRPTPAKPVILSEAERSLQPSPAAPSASPRETLPPIPLISEIPKFRSALSPLPLRALRASVRTIPHPLCLPLCSPPRETLPHPKTVTA